MLLDVMQPSALISLHHLIDAADRYPSPPSLGADIDAANEILLDFQRSQQERSDALLAWVSRHQPCLFGRLGAKSLQGIGIDVCWIDAVEIAEGDLYLQHKIQAARRLWKENAAEGRSHAFLIMFNDPR